MSKDFSRRKFWEAWRPGAQPAPISRLTDLAKARSVSQGRWAPAALPAARLPRNFRREKSLLMVTPRRDLDENNVPGRAASLRACRSVYAPSQVGNRRRPK